jgi:hypothetical protein
MYFPDENANDQNACGDPSGILVFGCAVGWNCVVNAWSSGSPSREMGDPNLQLGEALIPGAQQTSDKSLASNS